MFDAGNISVGRLAVRDLGASRTARSRALRRVENADPDVPLHRSEILIIRTLKDPMPGGLLADRTSGRWDRALAVELDWCRQHAANPISGPIPSDAVAVRFRDRAEMLTCLIEDLVFGRSGNWWWRSVLKHFGTAHPDNVLLAEPIYLPAVVEALVNRQTAVAVLSQMSDDTCRGASELFGVNSEYFANALSDAPDTNPDDLVDGRQEFGPVLGNILPARIQERVERALNALSRPAGCLLSVSLVRRFQPHVSGEILTAMTAEVIRLAQGATDCEVDREAIEDKEPRNSRATERSDTREAAHNTVSPQVPSPVSKDPVTVESAEREVSSRDQGVAFAPEGQLLPTAEPDVPTSTSTTNFEPSSQEKPSVEYYEDAPEDGVETSYAGVLFLVNVLEQDALSETIATLAATLDWSEHGAWSILSATARRLLGENTQSDDNIWSLLADLDGRTDETSPVSEMVVEDLANTIRSWFAQSLAALPASIHKTLPQILQRNARIYVGAMHIDVEMRLDTADRLTRTLGLDIDPGWCPRFGRIISFDYRE